MVKFLIFASLIWVGCIIYNISGYDNLFINYIGLLCGLAFAFILMKSETLIGRKQ